MAHSSAGAKTSPLIYENEKNNLEENVERAESASNACYSTDPKITTNATSDN